MAAMEAVVSERHVATRTVVETRTETAGAVATTRVETVAEQERMFATGAEVAALQATMMRAPDTPGPGSYKART